MTMMRLFPVAAVALFFISACSEQASEPTATSEPAAPVADEAASTQPASMPRTPSPEGARVFFITPADGDTVSSPVKIEFGIEGMSVVAAGVDETASGHHHLIVDADLPDNLGMPIPADEHYIHFGDGSTSTEITLEPGQHTLKLLLGDHRHVPHDPPVMSETITITVE
jgi:hypothetical protein